LVLYGLWSQCSNVAVSITSKLLVHTDGVTSYCTGVSVPGHVLSLIAKSYRKTIKCFGIQYMKFSSSIKVTNLGNLAQLNSNLILSRSKKILVNGKLRFHYNLQNRLRYGNTSIWTSTWYLPPASILIRSSAW